jgi:hypothetical protein
MAKTNGQENVDFVERPDKPLLTSDAAKRNDVYGMCGHRRLGALLCCRGGIPLIQALLTLGNPA